MGMEVGRAKLCSLLQGGVGGTGHAGGVGYDGGGGVWRSAAGCWQGAHHALGPHPTPCGHNWWVCPPAIATLRDMAAHTPPHAPCHTLGLLPAPPGRSQQVFPHAVATPSAYPVDMHLLMGPTTHPGAALHTTWLLPVPHPTATHHTPMRPAPHPRVALHATPYSHVPPRVHPALHPQTAPPATQVLSALCATPCDCALSRSHAPVHHAPLRVEQGWTQTGRGAGHDPESWWEEGKQGCGGRRGSRVGEAGGGRKARRCCPSLPPRPIIHDRRFASLQ